MSVIGAQWSGTSVCSTPTTITVNTRIVGVIMVVILGRRLVARSVRRPSHNRCVVGSEAEAHPDRARFFVSTMLGFAGTAPCSRLRVSDSAGQRIPFDRRL